MGNKLVNNNLKKLTSDKTNLYYNGCWNINAVLYYDPAKMNINTYYKENVLYKISHYHDYIIALKIMKEYGYSIKIINNYKEEFKKYNENMYSRPFDPFISGEQLLKYGWDDECEIYTKKTMKEKMYELKVDYIIGHDKPTSINSIDGIHSPLMNITKEQAIIICDYTRKRLDRWGYDNLKVEYYFDNNEDCYRIHVYKPQSHSRIELWRDYYV